MNIHKEYYTIWRYETISECWFKQEYVWFKSTDFQSTRDWLMKNGKKGYKYRIVKVNEEVIEEITI